MLAPWYCTREDVKKALDFQETARNNAQIDRRIAGACRTIENDCHRKIYPVQGVRKFDWPNYQYAYTWRLWLDQNGLISLDSLVSGGVTIPEGAYNLEPVNDGPPYSSIEIKVSSSSALSSGDTWQQSTLLTGLWGFTNDEAPAGALAADCTDSATTIQVSDSGAIGVGQLLRLGAERLIVSEKRALSTGLSLQADLPEQMSADMVSVGAGNGVRFSIDEVMTLDSERMLIVDILGDSLNVKRAWDGTVLDSHSGSLIYVPRLLTVTRGVLGTTAAAGSNGAPLVKWVTPEPVQNLAVAYASNGVLMETAGYARTVGNAAGTSQRGASSVLTNIAALSAEVIGTYGRKARSRAV